MLYSPSPPRLSYDLSRNDAFLRGINLGSRRRVSGSELRSLFADLGFSDVSTFRTSGNVVFTTKRGSGAETRTRIETGLAGLLGFDVGVVLRSAGEMRKLAAHEAFTPSAVERSTGKLQVMLLPAKPSASARKAVLALATPEDALEFGERELYWLPSGATRGS